MAFHREHPFGELDGAGEGESWVVHGERCGIERGEAHNVAGEAVSLDLARGVAVRANASSVTGKVNRSHIDVVVWRLALVGRAVPGDRLN